MSDSFLKNDLLQTLSESKHGLRKYLSERYTRDIVLAEANIDEGADPVAVKELEVFIVNTSFMDDQINDVQQKLYDMHAAGEYSDKLAYEMWSELVDMGAMVYSREYGSADTNSFTRDDRNQLTLQFMNSFKKDLDNDDPDIQDLKR